MSRYIALIAAAWGGLMVLFLVEDRDAAGNIILGATAVFAWMFVAGYGLRSEWRATAAGRAVMRLMLCIAGICTQGVATIVSDYGYPGRDVIRPLLLLGVGLAVLDMWWQLRRVQRADRHQGPHQ